MKICFVTDTFYPDTNGVSIVLKNYIDRLTKEGHEVVVIRGKRNKENKETGEEGGEVKESTYKEVIVYSVPVPTYEQLRVGVPLNPKVAYVLEKEKFDIIYTAHEWISGVLVTNLARLKGIPVVSAYHTNISQYVSHYGIGITKKAVDLYMAWFHNQSNAVIAHSDKSKQYLEDIGVKKPIHTLLHGVDNKFFSPSKYDTKLREEWGVDDDTTVILSVGRISEEKNHPVFFETIDELKKNGAKIKAVVVGEGPLKEKFEKEYPDVIFPGPLFGEDLAKAYASSDIFLYPSLTETFGMVYVEALASGLFTIGFDTAAVREYVKEGETGLKIKMDDKEEFIKRSSEFISNWNKKDFDRNKIADSISDIAWSNIITKLLDIFNETIKKSQEDKSILRKEIDVTKIKDKLSLKTLSEFFDKYI